MGCCTSKKKEQIEEVQLIVNHCTLHANPRKLDIYTRYCFSNKRIDGRIIETIQGYANKNQKRYRIHCDSWEERHELFHKLDKDIIIKFKCKNYKIVGKIDILNI